MRNMHARFSFSRQGGDEPHSMRDIPTTWGRVKSSELDEIGTGVLAGTTDRAKLCRWHGVRRDFADRIM